MQTLKQDTCPGLSGTNEITYEIGQEPDQSIWLRLVKSNRGGFVSKQWVSIDAVVNTLSQSPTPFTSYALHTHFSGKSINSPSFLMAALKHEGLVSQDENKKQAFVCDNIDVALANFQTRLSKDMGTPSTPKKMRPPRKPKPKKPA